MKDVNVHVQTLVNYIREHPNPEATAYLRLLGNEIGYMKTSEMTEMAGTLFMYFHVFTRVLPYKVSYFATKIKTTSQQSWQWLCEDALS